MDESTRSELKQLKEVNKSQNERIKLLEQNIVASHNLILSVEKLAMSVEAMAKEQSKHSEKIEKLESEPAKKWTNMTKTIFNNVTGAITTTVVAALLWVISQYILR